MSDSLLMKPVSGAVSGSIRPPGSKSITNRALILSALAEGTSILTGVLDSVDTAVMLESLNRLGILVQHDVESRTCRITGCGGRLSVEEAELWLENSGTSIRFLTSVCCLGEGRYRLDGSKRMRERPIIDLVDTLQALGASVQCEDPAGGCPPVIVSGQPLVGGSAAVNGNISSQFLSSLLMAAPCATDAVNLSVAGELVSQPYVTMTLEMMRSFGVSATYPEDLSSFSIPSGAYKAIEYDIEPDASAASYFLAAAAITGGTVTVEGLSKTALQGDVLFASALEQMGCTVVWNESSVSVTGGKLQGVDIDMNAISDTAQTLAVVATFASSPTTIRCVGHMRHKETDRIAAVVTELKRAGFRADEFDDGMTIYPGEAKPASIKTYDDHRMAMSFALLGLKHKGIQILDPGCTSKTYPAFFDDLQALCDA
ncbi:MAG: 3-phosphoshikimate 1-carboxyvinyltransferase [Fuerstiella sp.]